MRNLLLHRSVAYFYTPAVLQKDGSTADLSTRLISLAKQALEIGYDGVEINAGKSPLLSSLSGTRNIPNSQRV